MGGIGKYQSSGWFFITAGGREWGDYPTQIAAYEAEQEYYHKLEAENDAVPKNPYRRDRRETLAGLRQSPYEKA